MNLDYNQVTLTRKSRETLCEFLTYRGYDMSSHENTSENDIIQMAAHNELNITINNDNNKLVIAYSIEKSLRNLDEFIEKYSISPNDELIIVIKGIPNKSVKKKINLMFYNDNIFITVFDIHKLQYNIRLSPLEAVYLTDTIEALTRLLSAAKTPEFASDYYILALCFNSGKLVKKLS